MPNTDFGPMGSLADLREGFNNTLTDGCEVLGTERVGTEWGAEDEESVLITVDCSFYFATPYQEQAYARFFQGRGGVFVKLPLYKPDAINPAIESDELLIINSTDKLRITSTATGEVFTLEVVDVQPEGAPFTYGQVAKGVRNAPVRIE